MALETTKKIVYLPIYIFTKIREIRLVNCPITMTLDDNDNLLKVVAVIPDQLVDYLIVRVGGKMLVDGAFVPEYEFTANWGLESFSVALQSKFNYTENYISDSGWEIYKEHVNLDSDIFRHGFQEYEFYNFEPEPEPEPEFIERRLGAYNGATSPYFAAEWVTCNAGQLNIYLACTEVWTDGQHYDDIDQLFELAVAHTMPCNMNVVAPNHFILDPTTETVETFYYPLQFRYIPTGEVFTVNLTYNV